MMHTLTMASKPTSSINNKLWQNNTKCTRR